jgi:hypothetical protein
VAEWVALAAAVAPVVVMVVRAALVGWVPLFDAAYFTVRSRDVATVHNPLVGAWSMGSREVGEWINNLGPLQLDVLAPFTKLDPYWGTAVGVGLTNVAAIVGVWLVSRRLFTAVGVVGAMAATVLIVLNEGSLMLIEARQQLALVLPMWCLLWLAAATWLGRPWAVPWLVLAASFVVQTHFTYAYQTILVALAAVTAFAVWHRRDPRTLGRAAAWAGAVAVVCWFQPLWDQFAGTGNMSLVLGQSGGSDRSVGASRGLRILAESVFVPPFATPGSMGDLLRSGPRPSLGASVGWLVVWAGLLLAVAIAGQRVGSALGAMAAVALVALAGSVVAVVKIPPTEQFGIIAQNYYWAWPVGVFAATTLAGWVLRGATRRLDALTVLGAGAPRLAAMTLSGVLAGVAVLGSASALTPTNRLPETSHEWNVSRHHARPLMDQFGEALDGYEFTGPVLVELGAVRHVRYTLLTELQARGIDFRFAPGSTDLSRFGRERCDDGTATAYLTLRGGPDAVRLDLPGTLLASVAGSSDEQAPRIDELAAEFGDALRDGRVVVDDAGVEFLGGDVPELLGRVRSTDGLPARRLADFLGNYWHFDAVDVAPELVADLLEWERLEVAEDANRMAIYLEWISGSRPDRCGHLDPGDEFLGR